MALLAISASDIDPAGLALDAPLPIPWLRAELADSDVSVPVPGRLTARLSRSGGADIVVRGQVTAQLELPCARCLGPAAVAIDTSLSLLLQPVRTPAQSPRKGRDRAKEPEYEFTPDEADLDTYDGDTVILDPLVREAILLELPNFPLCSEACPGIAPAAAAPHPGAQPTPGSQGADKALDPRLAPLSALRDRLARGAREASEPPGGRTERPKKKKTKKE